MFILATISLRRRSRSGTVTHPTRSPGAPYAFDTEPVVSTRGSRDAKLAATSPAP